MGHLQPLNPRHMGEEANTGRSGRVGLVNQGLVSVPFGDSGGLAGNIPMMWDEVAYTSKV